jgi:hypothetical protein
MPDPTAETAAPVPIAPPAPEALEPAEVQELKELLARRRAQFESFRSAALPELPIADADRDRFAEHLWAGDEFTESFSAFGGKLSAVFRVREKWEMDLIARQVDRDYRDGLIANNERLADTAGVYNLRFQLVKLNGQPQDTAYPRKDPKAPSLREWTQDSVVETFKESRLAILLNWLSQFEVKVSKLMREAMEQNFTKPAAGI